MGCGKTTLGRAVALVTPFKFIDLDEYIEHQAGMTIKEIFATRGEDAFRVMERKALEETACLNNVIIACGGGTPCRSGMMEMMNSMGTTVWLQANPDVLHRRLAAGREQRPLIASIADDDTLRKYIVDNVARREPFYRCASACFDSSHLESEAEIAESVSRFISKFIDDESNK